jgi:hypothetical protein
MIRATIDGIISSKDPSNRSSMTDNYHHLCGCLMLREVVYTCYFILVLKEKDMYTL